MDNFKKGLKNYRTTVTGMASLFFAALAQTFPEWGEVFNSAAGLFALAFTVFVKDAATGSSPK